MQKTAECGSAQPYHYADQRRRAVSNYQNLDIPLDSGKQGEKSRRTVSHAIIQSDIFETLQGKFGFQDGSVRNQKEHYQCWVRNLRERKQNESSPISRMHTKFFHNYRRWCEFLSTQPHLADTSASIELAESQIVLYLLIWGEAANLRFMPECLCYIYHQLAPQLVHLKTVKDVASGSFLQLTVKPIYDIVARMRESANTTSQKACDYKNVSNYDDVNEFFWSTQCLQLNLDQVAEMMHSQELKTYKERRSFWNPFLAFFRIYFFLFVMLHTLIAVAFVAYRSDPELYDGLHFYANLLDEEYGEIRKHAFCSILISVSGLLALKVVLEVWMGGTSIFTHATYVLALFGRLVWHMIFFGFFCVVNASPYETLIGSHRYLDMAVTFIAIYLAPVIALAAYRMLGGNRTLFDKNQLFMALDGTHQQYIGRVSQMKQPAAAFMRYGVFWTVLFIAKFAFNLQLMIKPLIGPSVEIYQINVSSTNSGLFQSKHNLLFIIAMWVPMILVYIYDSQIWLAILQSFVGAFIGIRSKIGHSSRRTEFVDRLENAPALFDAKIVSNAAKKHDTADFGSSNASGHPAADVRLRFGVVWNEIVSSFRLSDLLDDRETAILQYQICDNGVIEDPVFLLAGKAQRAIHVAVEAGRKGWDDRTLGKQLEKENLLNCARNCIGIASQLLGAFLGERDAGISSMLSQLIAEGRVHGVINLTALPHVSEKMVKVLSNFLDLPEPTLVSSPNARGNDQDAAPGTMYTVPNEHVMVMITSVDDLLKSMEELFVQQHVIDQLRGSVFAMVTSDLSYQKEQLICMLTNGNPQGIDHTLNSKSAASLSNEDVICWSTRLFFLLTLDAADALPRCLEAQRRMSFFLNSLCMDIPLVDSIASMHSFSVVTPYYNEPVLYSIEELNGRVIANPLFRKVEHKDRNLSILKYLITFHSDEWGNFLERVGANSMEEALSETPTQLRLWASMRGQTLARTVHGIMMYEDALKMLRWLEIGSDMALTHVEKIKQMECIAGLKFSYVTSCQLYSKQLASGDPRAQDIDLLMRKYPNWRVSYVDTIPCENGSTLYDCVLIKSDGDEIVEVYRYALPGNPIVGEGKPENQNIALAFTRGEYVQTIDMNQEHYFEEALKIPNFLATADKEETTILGMKEHIFTGRASSLAQFMTLQELVFVSLTQRVLASPLKSRMHYGHPDVFDKAFIMSNGGVSKASLGINLSEDVFSGYNTALRGGNVTHVEFMQCGKGRDVTLSQINAFEAKLSNGSAESSLSREAYRMGRGMDFFRLNSMFYGHMGFYICNALTVLCVFCYAYSKLYVSLFSDIQEGVITKTKSLDDLAAVLNTQFIFQFGMLMTIPLVATLFVEFGWRQAMLQFLELILTLGPVFYIFETGTKAHYFDVAIMRGGSKYRGTGRGFAIVRETLVAFFKEYAASHYRKAVELMGLMILFGIYGSFAIGKDALDAYCMTMKIGRSECNVDNPGIPENVTLLHSYGSKGQDYGIASFAVWLLGICWMLAPFLFNTDGFDISKSTVDISNWMQWMMTYPEDDDDQDSPSRMLLSSAEGGPLVPCREAWLDFWHYEVELSKDMGWCSRLVYALRELRHPFCAYYVFVFEFEVEKFLVLLAAVVVYPFILWLGGVLIGRILCRNKLVVVRGVMYMLIVIGGTVAVPFVIGFSQNWSWHQSMSFSLGLLIGMYGVLQYCLILHGVFGIRTGRFGLVSSLGFFYDMVVGVFLVVPLLVLSAIPFVRTIQTRMMYNGGFSRALSTGSEVAASISLVIGLFAGIPHGWYTALVYSLGYVNGAEDKFVNESFLYFVNESLNGQFDMKRLSVYAALAGGVGVGIGVLIGHVLGRRMGSIASIVVTCGGSALVFVQSEMMIIVGVCVVAAGIAMLSINSILLNFEMSLQGWKGKGIVLFMMGSALGYMIEAGVLYGINSTSLNRNWANKPLHSWQYQFLYALPLLLLLLVVTILIPESPVWLYRHRDSKIAEATLVRLRQRHDVNEELQELAEGFGSGATTEASASKKSAPQPRNSIFRIALVLLLQTMYALLTSNALLKRESIKTSRESSGKTGSMWMLYFGAMNFAGVLLSLMSVDNVRRKTILKDILPFTSVLSIICGVLAVVKHEDSVLLTVILLVLFASASLSLTSVTWLTAVEIFPLYSQSRCIAGSFMFYYLIQAVIFALTPSFAISHFAFAALCCIATGILFSFCASSKTGAIELKSEKAARKLLAAKSADQAEFDGRIHSSSRASRTHSILRSRRQASARYTPSGSAPYEAIESPTDRKR
uniref:1,3-beta-glucan synthase n=1 Tax=Albugo laibachii Nc14 TaxID=890382 RepID=F0WKX5_9STRA|nr:callose synthase 5 putative [Albugo laibachii Nc14]CCA24784.1 unnamed protein product [Albugo laibachii Nc14]|eukprot:CCA24784.1 unnamed protein product [Albugo laibachii Nc14]